MYYEFYIDQFFVEHLLTGYLLLRMTAKRQRADVKALRILAGSFADTIIMTLCICTGIFWCRFLGMFFCGNHIICRKREKAVHKRDDITGAGERYIRRSPADPHPYLGDTAASGSLAHGPVIGTCRDILG